MKKLLKSKFVLLWTPAAMLVSGLFALNGSGAGVVVFVVVGMLSIFNAIWHTMDKDLEIEE